MTEAEWLACGDPQEMLQTLEEAGSNRKLRLFACACCRAMWALLPEQASRQAVEVAERYADKQATRTELDQAADKAREACWRGGTRNRAGASAFYAAASRPRGWPRHLVANNAWAGLRRRRDAKGLSFLRCIFGNPFRRARLDRAWLTRAVTGLAAVAYEERALPSGHLDPARLAVLADALEDAGCDDAELLGHLRGTGPHVRGCWVVDLLLGKS